MREPIAARLESSAGEPLVLKGVRAEGNVRGSLLTMEVEQHFQNPGNESLEVVYTFPLPWKAVLLNLEVDLGSKRLTGSVALKERAEERYEEALSQGDAAIMLEQNHDDSFSLNLGNLAPGEECKIALQYAQMLNFEHQSLRVIVPTVIAPRYGNPERDAGLRPHQAVSHEFVAAYPFDILVHLHGDLAKARVTTPNHPTSVEPASEVLTVRLATEGALDRDFVLVADKIDQVSIGTLGWDAVETKNCALAASFCPSLTSPGPPRPVAVKLLVDCSGSMAGDSIEAAKRALSGVLMGLHEGDRFSLSRFGSHVEHRCRSLWNVTAVSRLAAQKWVATIEADLGGTDMGRGLSSTFNLPADAGADVLLITDGQIHAVESTVALAKRSGHRLFVVGVGSSVSAALLRRLADETGGSCDFVSAGEAVQPAVERMFARLRCPRISDLQVVWPAGVTPAWCSAPPLSLFDRDALTVYALIPEAAHGILRLTGKTEQGDHVELAQLQLEQASRDGTTTVSRIAATARVAELEDGSSQEAHAPTAESLALAYQLVTKSTNFILTHERTENQKASDMPRLHSVPHMVPAGYAGTSIRSKLNQLAGRSAFASESMMACSSPSFSFDGPADAAHRTSGGKRDTAPRSRRLDVRYSNSEQRSEALQEPRQVSLQEFVQWLCEHSVKSWPESYDELVRQGVPEELTLWLKDLLQPGLPEGAVVSAFLQWMASPEFLEAAFGASSEPPLSWESIQLGQGVTAELSAWLVSSAARPELTQESRSDELRRFIDAL